MTETDHGPTALLLIGYVPLADHGFALPCFASGAQPNAWYTAICSVDGDHTGRIVGFEVFEADEMRKLPQELQKKIKLGDSWNDVFLWSDTVQVGLPRDILSGLESVLPDLVKRAPITLLDLALSVADFDTRPLVRSAFLHIDGRYGAAKAASWLRDTLVRQQCILLTRREIAAAGLPDNVATTVRKIDVKDTPDGGFHLVLPAALSAALIKAGRLGTLAASCGHLADTLGITIDARSFDDPLRTHSLQSLEIGSDIVETSSPLHRSSDILIIVSGPRADSVSRHTSSPDWTPVWQHGYQEPGSYVVRRVKAVGGEPRPSGKRPMIDIVTDRAQLPDLGRYRVVVWLADDEALLDDRLFSLQADISERCKRSQNVIPLIAPAPPLHEPSSFLGARSRERLSNSPIRCLVDTTVARSPFWSGNPRRALDRRVADIVTGAAVLCAEDSELRSFLSQDIPRYSEVVLSLTWQTRGQRQPQRALASEATTAGLDTQDGDRDRLFKIEFEVKSRTERGIDRGHGLAELRRHRPDFASFARAVVTDLASASGQAARHKFVELPAAVNVTLQHRDLAAAFLVGSSSPLAGVVVTAEAPTVSSLRAAAEQGWTAVRYTDSASLTEVLKHSESSRWPFLPREIGLPKLQRHAQNRGLATRGVDPRDIVRLPSEEFAAWKSANPKSSLLAVARRYRASIADEDTSSVDIALPTAALRDAISSGDRGAKSLASLVDNSRWLAGPSTKRPRDLQAAWSKPASGARRFALEDGMLPVTLMQLPRDEVPAQRLFIIDGDGSVPALLTSRLFGVWAQATLSRSTSWTSRFSISRTFETLPIPPAFVVRNERPESPPQLRLAQNSGRIGELVKELEQDPRIMGERVKREQRRTREGTWVGHPIVKRMERVLLSTIELPAKASDLDILERLLAMSRSE